jgi:hypothetical protein
MKAGLFPSDMTPLNGGDHRHELFDGYDEISEHPIARIFPFAHHDNLRRRQRDHNGDLRRGRGL